MDRFEPQFVDAMDPTNLKTRLQELGKSGFKLVSGGVSVITNPKGEPQKYYWAFLERAGKKDE
jgi:hypothetical protein